MKILIVDDIGANLRFLGRALDREGHSIVMEDDPIIALKILSANQGFGAIIVDYLMPEMDGFEFLRILRSHYYDKDLPLTSIPPCILITAWTKDVMEEEAIMSGFYKVLKKPFPLQSLTEVLNLIESNRAVG